ncbi:MAG: hypothetical protein LBH98_09460, partial [Chitinispirillales bacterium]|nr:hypothetical protein [Chitinispirillales bacterium]
MWNRDGFFKVTAAMAIAAQMVSAATDITAKFTDPIFKAEVYNLIGKTSGSPILDSDVSKIANLDVLDKKITSLDGIEYFTALLNLYCGHNGLTALDVSQNTNLTVLCCNDNQLTTLDVSNNKKLKSLFCHNNQLTELDVSNNTKLIALYCQLNQLTELDVSKNTKLLDLGVPNNQLTTLDVSNNTELWFLHIAENRITAIDLSKNTELEEFYCMDNQLTELNLLNNKALTKVYVERNLFASENDIKGLKKPSDYEQYSFEPQRRKNKVTFNTNADSEVAPLIDVLSFEKITEPAAPEKA